MDLSKLLEFVNECLDEDERIARAADPGLNYLLGAIETGGSEEIDFDEQHMLHHTPARVLVEVEVKRQLLALYVAAVEAREPLRAEMRKVIDTDTEGFMKLHRQESELIETEVRLRPVVLALASVYAGHPDYDEAWRP